MTVYVTPELEQLVNQVAARLLVGPKQVAGLSLGLGLRLLSRTAAAHELDQVGPLLVEMLANEGALGQVEQ